MIMISKLRINNFKIHKQLDISLNKLNILTGINSCGKSSVIQALLLLRQNALKGNLKEGLQLNGNLYNIGLCEDAICQYADDDLIGLGFETDGSLAYKWNYDAGPRYLKKDYIPAVSVPESEVGDINLFSFKFQYISASRWEPKESYPLNTNEVELKKQISLERGQCELIPHFLYHYGKEKVLIVREQLRNENCKETDLLSQVSAWERIISPNVNVISELEGKSYVLKYSYNRPNDIVSSKEYNAVNVGYGLSYALPIVVALLSADEDSLIIIENPEAHLHPKGQAELAKLIAKAAQSGIQIILETHSDHIINGILVASKMFEEQAAKTGIDKKNVSIFYFQKNELEQTSVVEQIQIVGDGKIDKQPNGFFDQTEIDLQYLMGF